MKKLLAFILGIIMLISMSACGAEESIDDAKIKDTDIRNANIVDIETGDIYTFGVYEQDNDETNGKEDIEWIVLDKEDSRVALISKYALDCKPYNTSDTDVTWETCTLRKWLNNEFFNSAFSDEEKAMIPTAPVWAEKNSTFGTNPGNDTHDRVLLLSIGEVDMCFSSDSARQCAPTDYALAAANGIFFGCSDGTCEWWLRSPGYSQDTAANVWGDGKVNEIGYSVNSEHVAVRPALWVELDS